MYDEKECMFMYCWVICILLSIWEHVNGIYLLLDFKAMYWSSVLS